MRNGATKSLEEAVAPKSKVKAPDQEEMKRYMEIARLYFLGVGMVPDVDEMERYVTEKVADDMGVLPFNLPFHVRQAIKNTVRGED